MGKTRCFVVKWDLVSIGGFLTFHGPFSSYEEAEKWVNKENSNSEEDIWDHIEILDVDQDFLKEYKVVLPDKVATNEEMYSSSDI
jgi:hypothetical protein